MFTLPASGPAQALIESLRATLAGDLAALERHFVVDRGGHAQRLDDVADAARTCAGRGRRARRVRRQGQPRPAHRGARGGRRSLGDDDQRRGAMTRRGVRGGAASGSPRSALSAYWLARHLDVTTDLSAFLPAAATPDAIAARRPAARRRRVAADPDRRRRRRRGSAARAPAARWPTRSPPIARFAFVTDGDRVAARARARAGLPLALPAESGDRAGALHRGGLARRARRSAAAARLAACAAGQAHARRRSDRRDAAARARCSAPGRRSSARCATA